LCFGGFGEIGNLLAAKRQAPVSMNLSEMDKNISQGVVSEWRRAILLFCIASIGNKGAAHEGVVWTSLFERTESPPKKQKARPSKRGTGFSKISTCARNESQMEPGLSVIEQIILDFKLWMVSGS